MKLSEYTFTQQKTKGLKKKAQKNPKPSGSGDFHFILRKTFPKYIVSHIYNGSIYINSSSGFRINLPVRPSHFIKIKQWHRLTFVPGYSDGLAPESHGILSCLRVMENQCTCKFQAINIYFLIKK